MPVTEQEARALAFLAARMRPHGARRWDEPGVLAAIAKVRDRSLAAVTLAVTQAAEDRNALTPGVIPTAGPHWRDPASAPVVERPRYEPEATCATCSMPESQCRTRWATDHEFLSVAASRAVPTSSAAEVLAAIRTAELCPHKVTPVACPTCRTRAAESTTTTKERASR